MLKPNRCGGPFTPDELRTKYGLGDVALGIREKCVNDPLYLGSELLGRKFLRSPAPEHRAAADAMVAQKDFLLLMPRGHLKTTLVDEVGTIHQGICYPNDRILFTQATQDNAKALAGQVREHCVKTRPLKEVFPEYSMDEASEQGQIMSYSWPCKTSVTRERSVEIGTPDASLSGRHYDLIACSDIVNEQTVPPPCGKGTVEMMQKINAWYGTTTVLLDSTNPRAHRRADGTRWHDGDLWGKLLKTDLGAGFIQIFCGIKNNPDGSPIPVWPRIPAEKLMQLRRGMPAHLWAANMMNDPLPPESGVSFRKEYFHVYEEAPGDIAQRLQMHIAITVDPAFTDQAKNPESDRSALVVTGIVPRGVEGAGRLYVLAYRAGRWSPRGLLEQLHGLIAAWSPAWVGIESGIQSEALKVMFFEDLQRTGRFVPYHELPPKGKNKLVRAMPLLNYAERFGIYVRPEHTELVEECMRFPVGEHEDLVDALAYRGQDLTFYGHDIVENLLTRPSEPAIMTGDDLLRLCGEYVDRGELVPWDLEGALE